MKKASVKTKLVCMIFVLLKKMKINFWGKKLSYLWKKLSAKPLQVIIALFFVFLPPTFQNVKALRVNAKGRLICIDGPKPFYNNLYADKIGIYRFFYYNV